MGYDRLHETITVPLATQGRNLHSALLAAKTAGYDDVLLDGTLIETYRVRTPARPRRCSGVSGLIMVC